MYQGYVRLKGNKRKEKCLIERNIDNTYNVYFSGKSAKINKKKEYFDLLEIKSWNDGSKLQRGTLN